MIEVEYEQESTPCPFCKKPVAWKWALGPHCGFMAEPGSVLVADCVYHAHCWDEIVAEHPPAPQYEYLTLSACASLDVRRHLLRARRAFDEGNDEIAYDRMAKAARWARLARRWA